jgi:5-methylcytosine-specific restriction enzyme subunit McrC
MAPAIPIQNLYYLLCYSWNRLAEAELVDVSSIDSARQVDLFAFVLARGTRHLLRRGLERGYQVHSETIPGIRGRIDIATTARRTLAAQGLAHCQFDELTSNTIANQILRSTLYHLARVKELDGGLRKQLNTLYRELDGIDCVPLNKSLFRKVQLHSNARFYKLLLSICELVTDSLMIDQNDGSYRFRDFLRDERRMARVYEEFLMNFYRTERPDLSVRKEKITWASAGTEVENLAYLPSMETDISIRGLDQTLIIDAKYYKDTLTNYFDTERVHSTNLYQLFAYLKNLEARGGQDSRSEGMLLYPVVNKHIRLEYQLHGHRVRICTVDLNRHWSEINGELLELIEKIE